MSITTDWTVYVHGVQATQAVEAPSPWSEPGRVPLVIVAGALLLVVAVGAGVVQRTRAVARW